MILNNEDFDSTTKIDAYKFSGLLKKVDSVASQGVKILADLRFLESEYGPEGTYSYSNEYLDFEQYVVFTSDTFKSCGLSVAAVICVIFFITSNLIVTILVAIAVLLVDFFIVALVFYWNLTMNSIVVIQVVIAIGLAVDYSAHIAHTYLTIIPPNTPQFKTKKAKRMYKASKSLSQMGSSIFHGGFSTFLAISVLAGSKSYVFVVFYKMWFGIILFAMANGFLLLPVVLSYIGPVDETKPEPKIEEEIEM